MLTINTNIRGLQPNDVVVPFSEIATLLRDRLSGAELDDLLGTLIGSRNRVVQPGDLITADWAMDVSNRISVLERASGGAIGQAINTRAVRTFADSWAMYRNLALRQTFFPDGNGNDAIRTAFAITTAIQNAQVAAIGAVAIAYSADRGGLLEAFASLYDVQHELAVLLAARLPGIPANVQPAVFAQRLNALLETDDAASGKLSLRNALNAKDVDQAIEAQDRINGIVANQSGDSVIGNIEVSYRGSTRGDVLALGDAAAFGFIFRVTNKTNRRLEGIALKPEFLAPRQAWTASTAVVGGGTLRLSLKPFDSNSPNDPGAFQDVTVNVTTPAAAAQNQTGTLRFTASLPAPVSVGGMDSVNLKVDNAAVPPQPSTAKFTSVAPVLISGNPAAAEIDDVLLYRLDFRYVSSVSPAPRDLRIVVSTTNSVTDFAKFAIEFDVPEGVSANAKEKVTRPFALADGQGKSVQVQVTPGAGTAGKTLNLSFAVVAVDDAAVGDSQSLSIKVKP